MQIAAIEPMMFDARRLLGKQIGIVIAHVNFTDRYLLHHQLGALERNDRIVL